MCLTTIRLIGFQIHQNSSKFTNKVGNPRDQNHLINLTHIALFTTPYNSPLQIAPQADSQSSIICILTAANIVFLCLLNLECVCEAKSHPHAQITSRVFNNRINELTQVSIVSSHYLSKNTTKNVCYFLKQRIQNKNKRNL